MREIIDRLIARGETISFVESMTGGAIAATMVQNHSASKVLKEALVAYSIEAKIKHLNIDKKTIEKYGVVSAEIAALMVSHYQLLAKTDITVSITGYADGYEPNEAYIGIDYHGEIMIHHLVFKSGQTRIQNIKKSVKETTKLIKKVLGK